MPRPWHVGPVPEVAIDPVYACFLAWHKHVGTSKLLWFKEYETDKAKSPKGQSLFYLRVLLQALTVCQPSGRFKPNFLRQVLLKIIDAFGSEVKHNNYSNFVFATVQSKKLISLMAHWRKICRGKKASEQAVSQVASQDRAEFQLFISQSQEVMGFSQKKIGVSKRKLLQRRSSAASDASAPQLSDQYLKFLEENSSQECVQEEKQLDSIDKAAIESAQNPAPAGRGAQKKEIVGKSSRNPGNSAICPGPLGIIKIQLAKNQSYICYKDHATNKWPLVVAVTERQTPDHKRLACLIFEELQKGPYTKEEAVQLRNNELDWKGCSYPEMPDDCPGEEKHSAMEMMLLGNSVPSTNELAGG